MKYLIFIYYFIRSLILRGPINSFQLFFAEGSFEKKFNIGSAGFLRSSSKEFFHYQGAAYIVLMRIFEEVVVKTKDYKFLDIGSGMGRAVFVAEYCGFNDLTGIELNEELNEIANKNKDMYSFQRQSSHIQFINENALEFDYSDEPTVYFLFNPFNADVLKRVLNKINKNAKTEAVFIYMNPLYYKVFEQMKLDRLKTYKSGFYTEAIIYRRRAS